MQLCNRFTDRSREILRLAAEEAKRLNSQSIDTEHILLGLIHEGRGTAASVLRKLSLHPAKILMAIETLVGWSPLAALTDAPHRSAAAEAVIECAIEEARELYHHYVGTERLLLGLLRQETGIAAQVLRGFGLSTESIRKEVLQLLKTADHSADIGQSPAPSPNPPSEAEREFMLDVYRAAVDFYKPRIEKQTGIALGDIAVCDYLCLQEHRLRQINREGNWLSYFLKPLLFKRRLRNISQSLATQCADSARQCAATYLEKTIYVSFNSGTPHDETLAETTVHELAHALWEKIAAQSFQEQSEKATRLGQQELEKYHLLVEGYAVFAQRIWFLNVYPVPVRKFVPSRLYGTESVYARGFRRIKKLVKQHGNQILLEIPKRWQSF